MPPRDLDVNRPLRSLNFSHLIGSPLLACIDAQEKAAQCSREYIEEVGLETDDDGKKEAIMVSFSFIQDGQAVELTVPLLSIVPIPYFSIDLLEINFRANVKISDGEITASYAAGNDSKNVQSSLYNVESAVDIHVKASQDDMPAGLSKVLGVLGNSIRSYSDSVEIPADADDQLVRLLCDVTHTPAIFTRKEDGEEVVDKVLTRIAEVDAMQVRELYINYKDYPFRDLGALSILTHLTNLTLTYDSAKVQKLDFKAVPNLTRLKLTDLNTNVAAAGTQEAIDAAKAAMEAGTLHVFDTSTWQLKGETLTSYLADVDSDDAYTPDTEVISDGYFHESEYRSAPYFDSNLTIDGINLLDTAF